eukprot:CAMPEP_0114987274 /NCGR_PEP_ID=MMETSP0216-20121206/8911_1 /TAXON_ID=223996 /ORGANISM="Protocruzia adherens, Strain Boccale" /LENGTH=251 /DNA_ID=CAMNT_0002349843 /DNA_START=21 /DNA_END=776 /DNA_ORIENTATION=+
MASRTNDVSKALGEKMLQGWAMLADHCEECNAPLMRDRAKHVHCLGCQRDLTAEEEIAKTKGNESEKKQKEIPVKSSETSSPSTSTEDVSNKLGEKMLQGWAMLAEHCAKCGTPLMRDRTKNIHCLGCGRNITEEEEEAKTKALEEEREKKREEERKSTENYSHVASKSGSTVQNSNPIPMTSLHTTSTTIAKAPRTLSYVDNEVIDALDHKLRALCSKLKNDDDMEPSEVESYIDVVKQIYETKRFITED